MTQELNTVITETFTTYRGCIIEKTATGFKVLGKEVSTIQEAREAINKAFSNIARSIK